MSAVLLRTKLYIPQPRPDLVSRPRLLHQLTLGFERKLTLVSAPPGFGKSTILSEWAVSAQHPVAWLSLDPTDNDFARFWSYTVAALQTVVPPLDNGAASGIASAERGHYQPALIHLINTITDSAPRRFSMVFDDLHVITEPYINDALVFLVENLPPQMHLMLTSRADPPWPLARLRARGELSEIRADDLRFTPAEAAAFLNDVMGLSLSPDDITALEERTEGWIAGLQMAALSMRGRDDVTGFVQSLSGSNRFIMDYLVEEVLERQPPAVREFLLKTSILDRLTAPLCDVVTGEAGSQTMLAELEQRNLFLMPQDDMRRWYRYHHLFGDLLHSRLLTTQPELVRQLHRNASTWYEQNGLLAEAMHHAQAGDDAPHQLRLIAENVLTMAYLGELSTLVEWLDSLPDESGRSQPWFCISRAWVTVFAGRVDAVEQHLRAAEHALSQDSTATPDAINHIHGHIAAIRAYVTGLRGDEETSCQLCRVALDLLPERDPVARGWTTLLVAIEARGQCRFEDADELFSTAATLARSAGVTPLLVDVLWERSQMELWQGRLGDSLRTCQDVLKLTAAYRQRSGRQLTPTAYTYAGIAAVLYEWNELDGAYENAQEAVRLSKLWGMADAVVRIHLQWAKILQARGEEEAAVAALQDARRAAEGVSAVYIAMVEKAMARLDLLQGRIDSAAQWATGKGLQAGATVDIHNQSTYLMYARLRLAQAAHEGAGALADALHIVDQVAALAAERTMAASLIEALIVKATIHHARCDEKKALDALRQALAIGEREGFVRIFVNEGAAMASLLHQAGNREIAVPYVTRLLAAFGAARPENVEPARTPVPLAEPLTGRELEVLRLLPTELSSTEIAGTLVVAPSTVRSHIKSIYAKLDAHGRTEAVDRAVELGLLQVH